MLIVGDRLLGVKGVQVWWPDSAEKVYPLLDDAHFVRVMQCSAGTTGDLRKYAFRIKEFPTPLLNLKLSEDELWKRLDRLCRRQIKKARELGLVVLLNKEQDAAFQLIQDFIQRTRFQAPISRDYWQAILANKNNDVFLCKQGSEALAARAVVYEEPVRAREFLSATANRQDPRFESVAGPANRLLLWTALLHYRERGIGVYDLGGVELDQKSPFYSIAEFKLSFGGEVTQEYILLLTKNRLLRVTMGGLSAARRAFKRFVLYPLGMKDHHELVHAIRGVLKRPARPAKVEEET